jgi:hypothetical protein
MQGNNQWVIEWRMVRTRQRFQVNAQGQTYVYKNVQVDDNVQVFADYQETLL